MNDQAKEYTRSKAVRSMQRAVAGGQTVTMQQVSKDLGIPLNALREAVGGLEGLYGLLLGPSFDRLLKTKLNEYRRDAIQVLESFPDAQTKLMVDIPPVG